MSAEIASLVVLVAMFLIASFLPVHLGALAFATAYGIGLIFGVTSDKILAGFPSELFVLLVGVTFLFALAQTNGTIDWIVERGVGLVRGRVALVPWLMFGLTTLIVAMGSLNAAGLACVAPIAMRCASRFKINPLMMALMIGLGSYGGGFSPISPLGVIVNGALSKSELPTSPGMLFLLNLGFATVVAAGVYLALGGLQLWRRGVVPASDVGSRPSPGDDTSDRPADWPRQVVAPSSPHGSPAVPATGRVVMERTTHVGVATSAPGGRVSRQQALTLLGIGSLVAGVLVFGMDVGLLAFLIAAPLSMYATDAGPQEVLKKVPWGVVLLIAGVLTYVGVLETLGTLDYVGNLVKSGASPLIALLIVCYVGAFVSAFAATSGVLVATIPFLIPLLQSNHSVSVLGAVAAMTVSSTIVDLSPMSTNGAVLLASQEGMAERVFFKRLLSWAVITVVAAPPLAWAAFIVLPSL